jgi:two-component SAPR family response regulator
MPRRASPLTGLNVLIVEDQYLIADEMRRVVSELGGTVVGPCATVADAIQRLKSEAVEFALLDLNLRGHSAEPVAAELTRRSIPFAFASGYEDWVVPSTYADHIWLEKPVTAKALSEVAQRIPRRR